MTLPVLVERRVARSIEPKRGADTCPALMYLARLRPSGRDTQGRALLRAAKLFVGGPTGLGEMPWEGLTYAHVLALRTRLQNDGMSPATVNKHLSAVRGVLRECWKLSLMTSDEYHRAKSVENIRGLCLPAGRMLEESELLRLVDAAGARDKAILGLCFGAGLRRAEAVSVDCKDLFPDRGVVRVRDGKGGKEREAFLSLTGFEWILEWTAYRPYASEAVVTAYKSPDRLSANALYDSLRLLCRRSKVAECSPHDLRRTFASRALDGGADLATVSSLMGHADPRTTARYDRRGDKPKRAAADSVGL